MGPPPHDRAMRCNDGIAMTVSFSIGIQVADLSICLKVSVNSWHLRHTRNNTPRTGAG
jgi:hypothetical protein